MEVFEMVKILGMYNSFVARATKITGIIVRSTLWLMANAFCILTALGAVNLAFYYPVPNFAIRVCVAIVGLIFLGGALGTIVSLFYMARDYLDTKINHDKLDAGPEY